MHRIIELVRHHRPLHVIQILRVGIEQLGLLLAHHHGRHVLGEECAGISAPRIVVNHHPDRRVHRKNAVHQRLAVLAVKSLRVPRVRRQGLIEIEQVLVGADKVRVNHPGGKDVRHRTRKIQARDALVDLAQKGHDLAVVLQPFHRDLVVQGVKIVFRADPDHAAGRHVQEGREGKLVLHKLGVEDGPGGKVRAPRSHVPVIGGTGFDAGIGHAERLDGAVDLPVEMDFAHVAVVHVYDPVGVVDRLDAVQRADFRLNGDAFVDRGHASGLALVVLVEPVAFNVFLGLAEAQTDAGAQTNVLGARAGGNHVADHAQKLGIGLAAQQREAVVGGAHIHRLPGLDHRHIDPA